MLKELLLQMIENDQNRDNQQINVGTHDGLETDLINIYLNEVSQ